MVIFDDPRPTGLSGWLRRKLIARRFRKAMAKRPKIDSPPIIIVSKLHPEDVLSDATDTQ